MTTRLQQLAQWRLPYARSLSWTMEGDAGRLHTWVSQDGRTVRRFAQLALLPADCPEQRQGVRCLRPLGHSGACTGPDDRLMWRNRSRCPADRGHPERCPDGCWCVCHRA